MKCIDLTETNFYTDNMIIEHKDIAFEVKRERLKAGMSQSELAQKAGVSRYTIAKLEQGDYKHVRFVNVMNVCKALGWNVHISYGLRSI